MPKVLKICNSRIEEASDTPQHKELVSQFIATASLYQYSNDHKKEVSIAVAEDNWAKVEQVTAEQAVDIVVDVLNSF